jgi:hypothetical protein
MSTSPLCAPSTDDAKPADTASKRTIEPELLEALRKYIPTQHPLIKQEEVGRAYVLLKKHERVIIVRIRNKAAWHTVTGRFKGIDYEGEFSETAPSVP